jgi:hypothetical protein
MLLTIINFCVLSSNIVSIGCKGRINWQSYVLCLVAPNSQKILVVLVALVHACLCTSFKSSLIGLVLQPKQ